MRSRDIYIILFAILMVTQFEGRKAATSYTCTKLADGSLKMELRTNDFASLMGYNVTAPTPTSTECKSVPQTVNSTEYQVFTVTTNANRVQTIPANLTTHNCFVTPSTVDSNAVDYKVLALNQSLSANGTLITSNGVYLNVSCDPDNTTQREYLSAAALNTQVNINSQEVKPTQLQFALSIVNFTSDEPFTPPVLVGTPFKAKIIFTRILSDNAVAMGLNGHSMEISGYTNFSQVVTFLNQNGCPTIQFNEAQRAGIESGFVVDTSNTDPSQVIMFSGKMYISAFLGAPTPMTYNMRVRYELCYEVTDKCNNIKAFCAAQSQSQGRKRRSSGNIPDEGDLTTSVEITYGPGGNDNQGGTGNKDEDEPTCGDIYKFWVVSSVLGALLLLAMLFAIYLYFRLRREQAHVQKMADKFGVSNTAVET